MKVRLPDEDPGTFDFVAAWMLQGKSALTVRFETNDGFPLIFEILKVSLTPSIRELTNIYVLADRLGMPHLKNDVIDSMIDAMATVSKCKLRGIDLRDILYAIEQEMDPAASKLIDMMVTVMACEIKIGHSDYYTTRWTLVNWNGGHRNGDFWGQFSEEPSMMARLFEVMVKRVGEDGRFSLKKNACIWHEHEDGEEVEHCQKMRKAA